MFERVKKTILRLCCHRRIYAGLGLWHGFAAVVTGKPEVYLPMAVLYLLLAVIPEN